MPARAPRAPPTRAPPTFACIYIDRIYCGVLDKIEGFDWDGANASHIMRHDVSPFEVEEFRTARVSSFGQRPPLERSVGIF